MKLELFKAKLFSVFEEHIAIERTLNRKYRKVFSDQSSSKYFKDNFFDEYRSIVFPENASEKPAFTHYEKVVKDVTLTFDQFTIEISRLEVTMTPEKIGILSLSFSSTTLDVNELTLMLSKVRSFDTKMKTKSGEEHVLSRFIEDRLLGFRFRQDADSDLYSDAKFKLFLTGQYGDLGEHNASNVLYDIATCSPLVSAGGKGFFAPHPQISL